MWLKGEISMAKCRVKTCQLESPCPIHELYQYPPISSAPNPRHTKKLFIKALYKKFGIDFDLASQKVEYKRLGPEQNARKREFMEAAKKLEGKRGMTGYNPYVHAGGIPLGQRQLVPYKLSGRSEERRVGKEC